MALFNYLQETDMTDGSNDLLSTEMIDGWDSEVVQLATASEVSSSLVPTTTHRHRSCKA